MTLECLSCQTPIAPDDRFCESCGTPTLSNVSPTSNISCPKCGPPSSIDADGYCDQCGLRVQAVRVPEPDDHIVVTLSATFAAVGDRGLKHHQNEDYFAIHTDHTSQIIVVCDGVSSSTAPQTASQIAAKTTCEVLSQALAIGPITTVELQGAISQAQQAVAGLVDAAANDPPSSTIVAAVVQAGVALISWLGDSRAYWIGEGGNQVLTTDHSWMNEQVSNGYMTVDEADRDPKAHAIIRWLGADAELELAPVLSFTMPGAGYLIVCSDGLWNYLSDPDHLATLISPGLEAGAIAQCLVDYANAKGGRDNITVAVLVV
jgi:PPM family protein phosphatase